jgi:predicted transcriptional regulator
MPLFSRGKYAAQIARRLHITKGAVSYWAKQLEAEGLIKCTSTYPKLYRITDQSLKHLTGDENRPFCRLEDYPMESTFQRAIPSGGIAAR